MARKLVSVVTGTWQRHALLLEAIENVRAQTYRPLEHVIVSDGPDDKAVDLVYLYERKNFRNVPPEEWVTITFAELGFWSSGLLTNSISAAPFMVAQLLARGDYQMWLADDERMLVPDHIEKLVDLIEQYEVDFAYPRVEMWREGQAHRYTIGTDPPQSGQFTHCLYRREALDRGGLFRPFVGAHTDADCLARMVVAGCRWAHLPEVTLSHRIDK